MKHQHNIKTENLLYSIEAPSPHLYSTGIKLLSFHSFIPHIATSLSLHLGKSVCRCSILVLNENLFTFCPANLKDHLSASQKEGYTDTLIWDFSQASPL